MSLRSIFSPAFSASSVLNLAFISTAATTAPPAFISSGARPLVGLIEPPLDFARLSIIFLVRKNPAKNITIKIIFSHTLIFSSCFCFQ